MLVHAYLMLALACNLMRNPAPSCFHYHICNAAAAVTAVVAILTCNMQHAIESAAMFYKSFVSLFIVF